MDDFKEVSIDEAKKIMTEKSAVILDVRDGDSYREGHIANALQINDTTIESFLKTTDKNAPILCYCYHGFSSQNAASFLVENGFTRVYSLAGGFEEWRKSNPISSGEQHSDFPS